MDTPQYLQGLIDDAAIFPPGNLPLELALDAHGEHRDADYGPLIGGFVVNDGRLPELCELINEPLEVDLVVTGGAGAIAGAVTWARRAEGVTLRSLDVTVRDEADLAHNARRVIAALDDAEIDEGVFVELPRGDGATSSGRLRALDVLAERDLGVKFRLGGSDPTMVPSAAELAGWMRDTLDRELRFKATAGLHRAVRHDGGHGFLNLLLATRAELDGDDAVGVLEERDGAALAARLDPEAMLRTRRWFTSFGSCSILEPHDDLVELGLL